MTKKIILSFVAIAAVAVGVVGMSAFEAHVINVTAKIENALSVPIDEIDFGTVFPQEQLDFPVEIALSDSFMAEDRVDDVKYMIRQKPKCGWTMNNGTNLLGLPTATTLVGPVLIQQWIGLVHGIPVLDSDAGVVSETFGTQRAAVERVGIEPIAITVQSSLAIPVELVVEVRVLTPVGRLGTKPE